MMSGWMMIGLCVAYVAIAVVAAFERYWPRTLYFLSATGITIAVLWMTQKNAP